MKWLDRLLGRKADVKAEVVSKLQAESDKQLDRAEKVLLSRGRLHGYRLVRLKR